MISDEAPGQGDSKTSASAIAGLPVKIRYQGA
jgi:hypothetical protein